MSYDVHTIGCPSQGVYTFQADSDTKIGLAISKCFDELMDGQINFVSQPLAASTFTFTTFF
jgi:light-regulated signal transduction histidine kinase (bacteriophytochrome)